MPVTSFAPDPSFTAALTTVLIAPTVASLAAPKVTETDAGTVIQCAIEGLSPSSSASEITRRKLCHTEEQRFAGVITRQLGEITVSVGNPQSVGATLSTLLALMPEKSTRYIVVRDGKAHDAAFAVGDKVTVWKVQIGSVERSGISADDTSEVGVTVSFSVIDRSDLFVAMVA